MDAGGGSADGIEGGGARFPRGFGVDKGSSAAGLTEGESAFATARGCREFPVFVFATRVFL